MRPEVIGSRPDAAVREIAAIAGISVGTAHDLRNPDAPWRGSGLPASSRWLPARSGRPGAGADQAVGGTWQRDDTAEPARMLAMRHTDSGRNLLRWLNAHALGVDAWPGLIGRCCRRADRRRWRRSRAMRRRLRVSISPPDCSSKAEQLERDEHSATERTHQRMNQQPHGNPGVPHQLGSAF